MGWPGPQPLERKWRYSRLSKENGLDTDPQMDWVSMCDRVAGVRM